jgi:hypothetical protein
MGIYMRSIGAQVEANRATKPPARQSWQIAILVWAVTTLVYGLAVAAAKALGCDMLRTAMAFPIYMLFHPRDDIASSATAGVLYGALLFLPFLAYIRSGKTVWVKIQCIALIMGPVACVTYFHFFFEMPVPD